MILSFLFILIGCSDDTPEEVIIPVIGQEEHENQVELPEEVSFQAEEETYSIKLGSIPMLAYYIASTEDTEATISKFKGTTISSTESSKLLLMSYACQRDERNCSYLLIKKHSEGETIIPITDIAHYQESAFTENGNHLLLQFNRKGIADVLTSHIVVVNLEEMEIVPLKNDDLEVDVLNYHFPIFTVDWIDNNELEIEIPDYTKEPLVNSDEENPMLETTIIQFEL
jgi:hypothetical protein